MKKKINIIYQLLACILIFSASTIAAQTGVLTQDPSTPLHIDAADDNAATPTAAQLQNDVVVTAAGNLGVGVLAPATKVDLRSADQKGIIGVGQNTGQTAAVAGAGAMRYSTSGYLEYSDGETWIPLPLAAPPKALVNATKTSTQSITSGTSTSTPIPITGWQATTNSGGYFDALNGTFTAPRTGFYLVSFNITLTAANIARNSFIETAIEASGLNGTTTTIPKFVTVNSYPAYQATLISNIVSGNCNGIFYLNSGATLKFTVRHTTGNRNVYTGDGGRFNNISISEL